MFFKKACCEIRMPTHSWGKGNIMCYNAALTDTMNFLGGIRSQKRYDHIIISF